MRKNILMAALVGGVSGLTFGVASADVVLSGSLIGAWENIRVSGNNTNANGQTIYRNRIRLNDDLSYVRISGLEDLGGGVQAGFQIESGFDPSGGKASGDNFSTVNSGNTTSGFGNRNTGLYFQGGFGKILFGRWDVFYDTVNIIEPERKSMPRKISLVSIFHTPTGGLSLVDSVVGDRYNNVLHYYTPKLYGLQLLLTYVPTNESSTLDVTYNSRIYSGVLVYKPDYIPLTAVASGFQQKGNSTTTGQQTGATAKDYNLTALRFAVVWKFHLADAMSLHVAAAYQPSKLAYTTQAGDGVAYKRQSWGIPLGLSFGPSSIYATFGYNGRLKRNDETQGDTDAKFYVLGYNYDFSKRTALGVYYTRLSNNRNASYEFYNNGLNNSLLSANTPTLTRTGFVPIAVGISFRHLF